MICYERVDDVQVMMDLLLISHLITARRRHIISISRHSSQCSTRHPTLRMEAPQHCWLHDHSDNANLSSQVNVH